jgi:hypothetical protein
MELIESYIEIILFKYFINLLERFKTKPLYLEILKKYLMVFVLVLYGLALLIFFYSAGNNLAMWFLFGTSGGLILIYINITYPNFSLRYPRLY